MNNLPKDFQHPGGFVEEAMNYINETAVCEQPLFALGAALTLAGILYGQKVQSSDGQRTNIFVMAIGYTSSGKDHALKSIAKILDSCNASHLRLGLFTSDSALEHGLKRQSRLCALIDEAGYFFQGVSDAKAKGSAAHSIKPMLLQIWSSANSRWVGKQRVPKDGKSEVPPVVIENPHLCIYSASQPQIMFEGITRTDLRDGWLARNLVLLSETRPKPIVKEIKEVPNTIRAEVLEYKNDDDEHPLVTVPSSEEAEQVFAAFNDAIYAKMLAADKSGDESGYLYGKALENSRRLALILAVSRARNRYKAVIEREDAEYATKFVSYLIESVIQAVEESLSENIDEKAKKRILKIIATSGVKGITRNELTRRTQFIRRGMRDEYLEDLLDGEQIVAKVPECGHGESYFLAGL